MAGCNLEILRLSPPSVEENLALDEELAREAGRTGRRFFRTWWGGPTTVVLGWGDKEENSVNLDACSKMGIGCIKRITGGGTVLQSPGVLNYSYTAPDPGLLDIRKTFGLGAEFIKGGLSLLGIEAQQCGISDVAVGDRKISGNAQARKWHAILLHGTLLFDANYELMEAVLKHPVKEPDYRRGRRHHDFLVSLRELKVTAASEEIETAFSMYATRVFGV